MMSRNEAVGWHSCRRVGILSSSSEGEERSRAVPLILVVDDAPDARRLLARVLRGAGHEALTAEDGPEALAILKARKPDLVILDIGMPEMDGLQVLEAMPRKSGDSPEPPVIMLTAFSDAFRRERSRELGASDYFVKGNFEASHLLERIEQLVA